MRRRALFHGTCLPLIQGEAELLAQAAGGPGDPLAPAAPRPPWSFYETIGWGMIAFIATSMAEPIVVGSLIAWHEWTQPGATDLHPMLPEAISTSLRAVVTAATWVGVISIAARWRHWRFADYVALIPPRRSPSSLSRLISRATPSAARSSRRS